MLSVRADQVKGLGVDIGPGCVLEREFTQAFVVEDQEGRQALLARPRIGVERAEPRLWRHPGRPADEHQSTPQARCQPRQVGQTFVGEAPGGHRFRGEGADLLDEQPTLHPTRGAEHRLGPIQRLVRATEICQLWRFCHGIVTGSVVADGRQHSFLHEPADQHDRVIYRQVELPHALLGFQQSGHSGSDIAGK